jgi:hypothetical protein
MKDHNKQNVPWQINEQDFPTFSEQIEQTKFLIGYAILAPSSHNTQPWKFVLKPDGAIDVFMDKDRWLKVADADQRELHLSVGCALENLLIAAKHFGFMTNVSYFPDPQNNDLAACVQLKRTIEPQQHTDDSLFEAIIIRHTNHKSFNRRRPIGPDLLQRFQNCCDEPSLRLYMTSDKDIKSKVHDLIVRSDAVTFANPEYREELAYWIGQGVFGTSWLMSQLGRLAMGYLNLGPFITGNDEEALMSAPIFALIAAVENDRVSQVKAGQLFERIYLASALLGIGVRPMSQIVEVPEQRVELDRLIQLPNSFPLQPFLLGYVEPTKEHTPRRAVEEVLF